MCRPSGFRAWVSSQLGLGPMAQPEFVPLPPIRTVRGYASPDHQHPGWRAERPGELRVPGQPRGRRRGSQGPDQGYVLKLAHAAVDGANLKQGEDAHDVIQGACTIALKRASLFGRAPVTADVLVALQIWGFLDTDPPADLLRLRRTLFAELRHPHDYMRRRKVADMVPDKALAMKPDEIRVAHLADWKKLLVKA